MRWTSRLALAAGQEPSQLRGPVQLQAEPSLQLSHGWDGDSCIGTFFKSRRAGIVE